MKTNTRRLVETVLMVALATLLSLVSLFHLPQGGSVTPACMVPIILISLKYGIKWSLGTSIVFSVIMMIIGFYAPPVPDFLNYFGMIVLDNIIAFGVLGLAGTFGRLFKRPTVQIIGGGAIVIALRFVCHFVSGITVWASNAPADIPVWQYSLTYNGSYMLGELVISVVVLLVLSRVIIKYILPGGNLQKSAQ